MIRRTGVHFGTPEDCTPEEAVPWADILPQAAAFAVRNNGSMPEPMWREEEAHILLRTMTSRRRLEFRLGRNCAREALARLGIVGFPVLPDGDRAPIWPRGLSGSISHSGGCVIATALRSENETIGVDVQITNEVLTEMAPILFSRNDRFSESLDPASQRALAFSAKESVFKAVFPVFRAWLGFRDIEVDADGNGGFRAWVAAKGPHFPRPLTIAGKYAFTGRMIATAVTCLRGQ